MMSFVTFIFALLNCVRLFSEYVLQLLSISCVCSCFRECLSKFGDELGEKVWKAVNDCFDAMPLAATVDGKVCSAVYC